MCDKIFTEKGNLKVHIRVHTNDRPFHCPYTDKCDQAFKTRSQLNDHILKHTQIKNHMCPECNASFSRKSRLKIHLMIHKGEKPFQCEICLKQFREKSNYNYHMKKHDNLINKKSMKCKNALIIDMKNSNLNTNTNNKNVYRIKKIYKISDNSNTTKSNSNNSFEKNSEDENLVNFLGQNTQSSKINQQYNINNKESKSFDLSGINKGLKIFDEDNKNSLFNFDYVPYCHNDNILNEESEISSILGEKEKYNIDDLSIANGEFNNFSSGNDLNLKLISSEFNNNFYSSEFKFNFENAFLKENLN